MKEVGKEKDEVERPDAQNAADVEGLELDRAGCGFFALEELGDEVGAEEEEEADTELARDADVFEWRVGIGWKGVAEEDEKKGDETEAVQFGFVEPGRTVLHRKVFSA